MQNRKIFVKNQQIKLIQNRLCNRYNATIGAFWHDANGYIMAYGEDIDGDIAAVKKLVSARDLFFNKDLLFEERTKVIDDFDLTGIAVIDILQNPSNKPYYNQRYSDAFANAVNRILNNNNFEIENINKK